jgi:hexosaminidase
MLDPARHFYTVTEVKQFIDTMAYFKLNVLHLHLTDDQGWRIEIKSWPNLTEIGGSTAVGGGSGGYYTQQDYQEIVRYAHERYITIIPEIDMPGHVNAALASYTELNDDCDDDDNTNTSATTAPLYTGTEVGFSTLCIHKEITYQFIDDVIREVAAITPGPYIHVGGDESKQTSDKDSSDLFAYFMGRVLTIVEKHGKRLVAWDEVAKTDIINDNGSNTNTVIQYWNSESNLQMAIEKGAMVIMSPSSKSYLDMKYYADSRLGLQWAGLVNTEVAYRWDPTTIITTLLNNGNKNGSSIPENRILGIEAPLWGETTENLSDLQWLAYPRLIGHAEIGWSSSQSSSGRSWNEYKHRLSAMKSRLDIMGVNCFHDPVIP